MRKAISQGAHDANTCMTNPLTYPNYGLCEIWREQ